MVAHGLLAALTFGLSGYLYQQTRTLDMSQLGGLLQRLPFHRAGDGDGDAGRLRFARLREFVGEVMVLFGMWKSGLDAAQRLVVVAAWGGLIIGAVYMLRAVRKPFARSRGRNMRIRCRRECVAQGAVCAPAGRVVGVRVFPEFV